MHINGYIACYTARGIVAHVARAALHSLLNGWCNKLHTHTCDVSYISLIYIIYIIYVPIYIDLIQHYTNRLKYSASNIPTFSRRESSLPGLVHPFFSSLQFPSREKFI